MSLQSEIALKIPKEETEMHQKLSALILKVRCYSHLQSLLMLCSKEKQLPRVSWRGLDPASASALRVFVQPARQLDSFFFSRVYMKPQVRKQNLALHIHSNNLEKNF
jgi:hypothetical protein